MAFAADRVVDGLPVDEGQNVGLPVDEGEDVEHGGDVRMIVAARLLEVLERLLAKRHGHLVSALGGVLND